METQFILNVEDLDVQTKEGSHAHKATDVHKVADTVREDEAVYSHLLRQDPEGKVLLSEKEKVEFESWLGV